MIDFISRFCRSIGSILGSDTTLLAQVFANPRGEVTPRVGTEVGAAGGVVVTTGLVVVAPPGEDSLLDARPGVGWASLLWVNRWRANEAPPMNVLLHSGQEYI